VGADRRPPRRLLRDGRACHGPTLGLSALTAIVVSGQLAIAIVVDRFGLLGIARQHIALHRIVGLVLLLAGVVLVVRR
jgi:transporter family-2 protein